MSEFLPYQHTHSVVDLRGGQQSHASNPQHSLSLNNNLTNSESLDLFIQCPKSHDYGLISTKSKIHDYSLTTT